MRSWQMSSTSILSEPSELFESLAASVHNAWVTHTIQQGRTTHPNLKPYFALPEDVKETSRCTVRALLDALCLTRVMKQKGV